MTTQITEAQRASILRLLRMGFGYEDVAVIKDVTLEAVKETLGVAETAF